MLRVSRMLKIFIPCSLFLFGLVVLWALAGDSLRDFFQPPLVEVEGQVLLNGEPLARAHIETFPVDSQLPGSSAMSDTEGRFRMTTFVENRFRGGVFAGQHQVTVVVEEPAPGGFGVRVLSPEAYADLTSSPLTVTVPRKKPLRDWKIELSGILKPATSEADVAAGAHPGEGYIALPLFQQFDRNNDRRLGPDERQRIGADMLHGVDLEAADSDGDGYVDREELNRASVAAFGTDDDELPTRE